MWGGTLRFLLAAALLAGLMVGLRVGVPRGRALLGATLYGAFNFGASFALAYYALVDLHAGIAQTLLSVVPLMALLLAVAFRQERLRFAAVVGTALSVVGVAVVTHAPVGQPIPVLPVLAVLANAACIAQAAVLVRLFPPVHPVAMNTIGVATGGVILLGCTLLTREQITLPHRVETWMSLLYSVPIGTVLVFALYLMVLRRWAASRAAYTYVVAPVTVLLLSAWLDKESLRPEMAIGGFLVLAGVYVGALRRGRSTQQESSLAGSVEYATANRTGG